MAYSFFTLLRDYSGHFIEKCLGLCTKASLKPEHGAKDLPEPAIVKSKNPPSETSESESSDLDRSRSKIFRLELSSAETSESETDNQDTRDQELSPQEAEAYLETYYSGSFDEGFFTNFHPYGLNRSPSSKMANSPMPFLHDALLTGSENLRTIKVIK